MSSKHLASSAGIGNRALKPNSHAPPTADNSSELQKSQTSYMCAVDGAANFLAGKKWTTCSPRHWEASEQLKELPVEVSTNRSAFKAP